MFCSCTLVRSPMFYHRISAISLQGIGLQNKHELEGYYISTFMNFCYNFISNPFSHVSVIFLQYGYKIGFFFKKNQCSTNNIYLCTLHIYCYFQANEQIQEMENELMARLGTYFYTNEFINLLLEKLIVCFGLSYLKNI